MHNRIRLWKSFVSLLVVALLVASASAAVYAAPAANPGVLPPNSRPHGKSYAEWSAEHWKWLYSISVHDPPYTGAINHPLVDETGAKCGVGQSGDVWFLGGPFNSSGIVVRDCTVPTGTMLFFPLVDVECSNVEPAPFFGANEAELRACVAQIGMANLTASVDGVAIQNLQGYRVQSPLFSFTVPEDNLLGISAGTTGIAVSDGYFLMLAPLSAGQHTVHFGGTFPDFSFTLDATYHLTVAPGH